LKEKEPEKSTPAPISAKKPSELLAEQALELMVSSTKTALWKSPAGCLVISWGWMLMLADRKCGL